jgi:iron(II)-dependent oxidoreductase
MKIQCIIFFCLLSWSAAAQDEAIKNMVLIPSGNFTMGKVQQGADFSPAHPVKLNSFYMDIHEVTNAEYKKFCQATGHKYPEFWNVDLFRSGDSYPNHPVIGISWSDANTYAAWAGKRLPTEAEWEYAARGGLVGKEYPTGDTLERIEAMNSSNSWTNGIVEVALFKPNAYGLYDMDGNVWEWTADGYDENYYKESPTDNPKGPDNKRNKVIRSGSWHSGGMCKKVYYRKGLPTNWVDFGVGFRCVKDVVK